MTPAQIFARWLGGFAVYVVFAYLLSRAFVAMTQRLPDSIWRLVLAHMMTAVTLGYVMWMGGGLSVVNLALGVGAVLSLDVHRRNQHQTWAKVSDAEIMRAVDAQPRARHLPNGTEGKDGE